MKYAALLYYAERLFINTANNSFLHFLQQTYLDELFVNLRMEAVFLKENFNIKWVAQGGIVENIEQVVNEYKLTRGLLVIIMEIHICNA